MTTVIGSWHWQEYEMIKAIPKGLFVQVRKLKFWTREGNTLKLLTITQKWC